MLIELPEASISSVLVLYWETPCWLATLPVLTTCWVVGQALTLLPLLLKLDDGEAEPLEILLSENPWLTPGGSLGSELLVVLVLEGSELLLLELKEGSELLLMLELEEGSELLLLTLGAFALLSGPSGGEKFAEGEKPKGDSRLSVTNPTGLLAQVLPGAATAGMTKAAAKTTTKPPTMIIRRTITTSFSRNDWIRRR
jgi:hypothetical protein